MPKAAVMQLVCRQSLVSIYVSVASLLMIISLSTTTTITSALQQSPDQKKSEKVNCYYQQQQHPTTKTTTTNITPNQKISNPVGEETLPKTIVQEPSKKEKGTGQTTGKEQQQSSDNTTNNPLAGVKEEEVAAISNHCFHTAQQQQQTPPKSHNPHSVWIAVIPAFPSEVASTVLKPTKSSHHLLAKEHCHHQTKVPPRGHQLHYNQQQQQQQGNNNGLLLVLFQQLFLLCCCLHDININKKTVNQRCHRYHKISRNQQNQEEASPNSYYNKSLIASYCESYHDHQAQEDQEQHHNEVVVVVVPPSCLLQELGVRQKQQMQESCPVQSAPKDYK